MQLPLQLVYLHSSFGEVLLSRSQTFIFPEKSYTFLQVQVCTQKKYLPSKLQKKVEYTSKMQLRKTNLQTAS